MLLFSVGLGEGVGHVIFIWSANTDSDAARFAGCLTEAT